MINTNELRIGNLIKDEETVFEILSGSGIDYVTTYKEKFSPIPLTPEILEKAGFIKTKITLVDSFAYNVKTSTETFEYGDIFGDGIIFEVTFTSNARDNNVAINTNLKMNVRYLHELQNLYFAHYKEELEIIL